MKQIQISANGTAYAVAEGTPLPDFIAARGLDMDRVVIEYNESALGRDAARAIRLHAGDRLEIVRIVAGG
jgi:sulfur carrier protein